MLEILGKTTIDFMGQRRWAFIFSGIMVVLGLVALIQIGRGAANLGIDFSGVDETAYLWDIQTDHISWESNAVKVLAVRNALGSNRDTIEIVHLLGGTDAQIARIFQRAIGYDAGVGGVVGLVLGLVVVLLLGQQFAALGAGLVSSGALEWSDWLLLALIPVIGVVLAMFTARQTVVRALRKML